MDAGPWIFQSLKFPDRRSGLGMACQTPREEGRSPGDTGVNIKGREYKGHARHWGFLSGSHSTCYADAVGLEPRASTC